MSEADGRLRVIGHGPKRDETKLREEMEHEVSEMSGQGFHILSNGLIEHSPGYLDWWVLGQK